MVAGYAPGLIVDDPEHRANALVWSTTQRHSRSHLPVTSVPSRMSPSHERCNMVNVALPEALPLIGLGSHHVR
jgi:hypothetical protein